MKPKVSICIPASRPMEYLHRALDSVLIQTYRDYELVITDDSPEGSIGPSLAAYSFGDKLKYSKNKARLGAAGNWNEAVRLASGEYIKMLHDDDWFTYEDSLGEYVRMLDDNPQAQFAFSSLIGQYHDSGRTWIHSASPQQIRLLAEEPTSLFCENFIGGPSAVIYRRDLNKPFDKNLKWVVDIDFYISVLSENNFFVHNARPLITGLRGTGEAITDRCMENKNVEIFERFYVFDKIKEKIPAAKIKKYLLFLFEFALKYKVKSLEEIRACGYQGSVPKLISILLFLNNLSPLARRFFIKAYKTTGGI